MRLLCDCETSLFFSMRSTLYGNLRARPTRARRQCGLWGMEGVSSEVLRPRTLNKAADALCKSGLLRCHVTTRLAKERGDLTQVTNRIVRSQTVESKAVGLRDVYLLTPGQGMPGA